MTKLLTLSICIMLCGGLCAQTPDTIWTGLYGDRPPWFGYDQLYGATPTSDGGFAMNGYSTTSGDTIKGDQWVVKIDGNGDTLWTRTFGAFDRRDYGRDIIESYDGNLIVAGHGRIANTTEAYRIRLFKIDQQGNQIWEKDYVRTDGFSTEAIVETSNRGFAITGWTDAKDIFLFRADSLGDSVWTRTYGGPGDDLGYDICQTADDGFMIVGMTESYGAGSYDIYVIRTDTNGDTLWTRTFGSAEYEEGRGITPTHDGNYLIAGAHVVTNTDVWLIKIQDNGDTLWSTSPGQESANDNAIGVTMAPDNGFVVAGRFYNTINFHNDMYVLKVDADGEPLWYYSFISNTHDEGVIAYQLGAGPTYLFGTRAPSSSGEYRDYWAIALASVLDADDSPAGAIPETFALSQNYPNPFNPSTRIDYTLAKRDHVNIVVYDLLGRQVATLVDRTESPGAHSVDWDGHDRQGNRVATGVYFYRLRVGDASETRSMLLLK